MSSPVAAVHNAAANRYEIVVDGHVAVLDYRMESGRQVITRTFVPPELRGKGLAELLVRAALDDARVAGRKVEPACSYVDAFMSRHADYAVLRA